MLENFDVYTLEYALVRLRNRLDFLLRSKGETGARKLFCLGPAKSGTSSLHALFEANGLTSLHSAGNWPVADYDCFSDRGDYRPFERYDSTFPNAVFILNCRPLGSYMKSLANHLLREGSAVPNYLVNSSLLVGQALRRSAYHERVLRYFYRKNNILIVDIEREGSISFVASKLGLRVPEVVHHHRTKVPLSQYGHEVMKSAIMRLGGPQVLTSQLILGQNGESSITQSLLPASEHVWL
ncbi:hypothetical protein MCEREM30_01075 [Paracoccaceae bacterium]